MNGDELETCNVDEYCLSSLERNCVHFPQQNDLRYNVHENTQEIKACLV